MPISSAAPDLTIISAEDLLLEKTKSDAMPNKFPVSSNMTKNRSKKFVGVRQAHINLIKAILRGGKR